MSKQTRRANARARLGQTKLEAWCQARKGSKWARHPLPDHCEFVAKQGSQNAQAVINRYHVLIAHEAKLRLLGQDNFSRARRFIDEFHEVFGGQLGKP